MAEAVITTGSKPPRRRLRQDWPRRLLNELFAAFVALLFLLAGALVLLDTAPGHRFIVDRIGRFETASGLKVRIGRIDGSIFGKSQLRNVSVSDQRGVFLTSPNIKLDAAPDRNRFDVAARVIAPNNGLIPALAGTRRSMNLEIGGKGSWTHWRGTAILDLSGRPTARLALGVDSGRYLLQGKWAPAQF